MYPFFDTKKKLGGGLGHPAHAGPSLRPWNTNVLTSFTVSDSTLVSPLFNYIAANCITILKCSGGRRIKKCINLNTRSLLNPYGIISAPRPANEGKTLIIDEFLGCRCFSYLALNVCVCVHCPVMCFLIFNSLPLLAVQYFNCK